MPTERKSPDAIIAQTNLTGALSAIQDDPDAPDANWWTMSSNNADTVAHVSFPTPTGNPTIGANLQQFKIWVRKQNGTGTPQVRIELYENGVSLATILANTNVTSGTGELFSATWNANLLGTADGSLVEIYIYGTKSGGSPSARATVEVGAVEWNVVYSAGGQTYYQNVGGGSTTPASEMGKMTAKPFGQGVVTISAALSRASSFYRSIGAGAVSISASLAKATAKAMGDASMSISGVLSTVKLISQAVGDASMAISGTLSTIWTRFLNVGEGSVTISGALSRASSFFRAMGDGSVNITGAVTRVKTAFVVVGAGSLSIASTLATQFTGGGQAIMQVVGGGTVAIGKALGISYNLIERHMYNRVKVLFERKDRIKEIKER